MHGIEMMPKKGGEPSGACEMASAAYAISDSNPPTVTSVSNLPMIAGRLVELGVGSFAYDACDRSSSRSRQVAA